MDDELGTPNINIYDIPKLRAAVATSKDSEAPPGRGEGGGGPTGSGELAKGHAIENDREFFDEVTDEGNGEGVGVGGVDDSYVSGWQDPITLPPSTHSLLFTEPVNSRPFALAAAILAVSFACLALALSYELSSYEMPVNVKSGVRGAQYLAILVALLMEEEIPTGLYLLRMIPHQSLIREFPHMKYRKFTLSSVARILNGYLFLINVMAVVTFATVVLDIFYDMLALQFVQQLDDIAFILCKKDVFGKEMKRACTAKCFRTEFDRQRRGKSRKLNIFLKAIYFVNLFAMLSWMVTLSIRQRVGYYQPQSIKVDFGDTIWGSAWVEVPSWVRPHVRSTTDEKYEDWTLIYSHFNGVYERGEYDEHGWPVYRERSKHDRAQYEVTVPAEIKYCKELEAWIFTHESISKTKSAMNGKEGCNWLLRSPQTDEFDLTKVEGDWQIWVGVIQKASISITRNKCRDDSECNLNGICGSNGMCECNHDEIDHFLGMHCEVVLPEKCRSIIGEGNEIFSVASRGRRDILMEYYSRPVYFYQRGSQLLDDFLLGLNGTHDFYVWNSVLVYGGNRWFGAATPLSINTTDASWRQMREYHAFWNRLQRETLTHLFSDVNTGSTPVGTDFYKVVGRGDQFGPFGDLKPLQPYPGRGYFRCMRSNASKIF